MERDDRFYRVDALDAIRLACEFVHGMDYGTFLADARTQRAVIRQPEVLGEVCGHVSPELRAAHPDVPWAKIVGMRNKLSHAYFGVDLRLTWTTVHGDLVELAEKLCLIQEAW